MKLSMTSFRSICVSVIRCSGIRTPLTVLAMLVLASMASWASPPEGPASPAAALSAGIASTDQQRSDAMDALAREEKGLLVICASKEAADAGPEMLEVFVNWGKVSEKIGEAGLVDPRSASVPGKDIAQLSGTIAISETQGVTTSRYIGEIPFQAGEYTFTLERMFPYHVPGKEHLSALRTHDFYQIKIQPGKATILSFFWQIDEQFGDHAEMSASHRKLLVTVAKTFGDRLSEVHQHTEP